MTATIIITICILLLIAYLFDLSSSKTRIPSVILLLLLGWLVQQGSTLVNINIPDLSALLPILGTVGLILIVLEGALELEFNRSKIPLIRKSLAMAFISIMALSFLFAFLFQYFSGITYRDALINAIPFSVISSSIAIPSVRAQSKSTREFVIYESSLSDIIGILFFNFIALNTTINGAAFGFFGLDILIMAAISFVATLALAFLLNRIEHHIKFAPIIILIILVYEISKVYNLPSLLFVLLFGLFLGNLDELKRFKWIERLKPDELDVQTHRFSELVVEATFLVRTIFFILFGYLMKTEEILNTETLKWACIITACIFLTRALFLKVFRLSLSPLSFIAPRGLINILLFLSITQATTLEFVNKSLMIQVIFLSAIVMMVGIMISKKPEEEVIPEKTDEETSNDYLI